MRLHRDAVLRPQHGEMQRRHDGGERGARRLMAADLQPIAIRADVVGVVDGPRREPQNLAFQLAQEPQALDGSHGRHARGIRLRIRHVLAYALPWAVYRVGYSWK